MRLSRFGGEFQSISDLSHTISANFCQVHAFPLVRCLCLFTSTLSLALSVPCNSGIHIPFSSSEFHLWTSAIPLFPARKFQIISVNSMPFDRDFWSSMPWLTFELLQCLLPSETSPAWWKRGYWLSKEFDFFLSHQTSPASSWIGPWTDPNTLSQTRTCSLWVSSLCLAFSFEFLLSGSNVW